ncbi:MAG: hypothetical protein JWO36_1088 [Myxococcales bacterium]|nr:hypothetical protein [Myxococcales bacterium]
MGVSCMGRTLVVTSKSDVSGCDIPVVRTMLDMITSLERAGETIATVILNGDFLKDRQIAAFLRETYPFLEVVVWPASGPCVPPSVDCEGTSPC